MSDASTLPAERALIGALLVSPEIFSDVALMVRSGDFGDLQLGAAFGTMHQLAIMQKPITLATVAAAGNSDNHHLLICLEDPSPMHWQEYAQLVSDAGRKRQLLIALRRVVAQPPEGGFLGLSSAVAKLQQQAEEGINSGASPWLEVGERALESLGRQVERREQSGESPGIPWCIPWLQRVTGGLYDGEFIVIAGRPGTGKSALLNQQGMHSAKNVVPGEIISLEMQQEMLMMRALSHQGRINAGELRAASREAYEAACEAFVAMANYGLWIDTQVQHIVEVVASITLAKRKHNIRWAGVDNLQLIGASGSRIEQMSTITRSLKLLAMKLNIPIIGLSHMSRDIEKSDRFPRMSDLRDSGTIEQDADSVIFIHKKANGPDSTQYYFGVEKGRSSDTAWTASGTIEFEGHFQTFKEIAPYVRDAALPYAYA